MMPQPHIEDHIDRYTMAMILQGHLLAKNAEGALLGGILTTPILALIMLHLLRTHTSMPSPTMMVSRLRHKGCHFNTTEDVMPSAAQPSM